MALLLGNIATYNFLTGKYVLLEKELLEKAATMKRFKCSPLVSGLKKQTDIAKHQHKVSKDQKHNTINNNREDDVNPNLGGWG